MQIKVKQVHLLIDAGWWERKTFRFIPTDNRQVLRDAHVQNSTCAIWPSFSLQPLSLALVFFPLSLSAYSNLNVNTLLSFDFPFNQKSFHLQKLIAGKLKANFSRLVEQLWH